MGEPTYRCGWRYLRSSSLDPAAFGDNVPFFSDLVEVRRGEWRWRMQAEFFDTISDEQFTAYVTSAYREVIFEHLERDLDILARQLLGELELGNGMIVTGVPYDDIKAALYRWQKTKRDTQEVAK